MSHDTMNTRGASTRCEDADRKLIRDKNMQNTQEQEINDKEVAELDEDELNAVAGGGSFIAFPALLFAGVAPIAANASNAGRSWARASTRRFLRRSHSP